MLTIEMLDAPPRKYPGLRIMLTLQEGIYLDPAIGSFTSKLATEVSASGIVWQTING
jgi:hypothetical protein